MCPSRSHGNHTSTQAPSLEAPTRWIVRGLTTARDPPAAISLCIQDREGDATTEPTRPNPKEPDTLEDTYRAYSSTSIVLFVCVEALGLLWSAEGGRRFMRAVWPQRSRSPPPYGPNFARAPRPLVGVSIVVKQSRCSSTQRVARDYDKRLPKQALCHSRE